MANRFNTGKIPEVIDTPDLISVQLESWAEFLQFDRSPEARDEKGLQEAFNDSFPIKSYDENIVLHFVSYEIGKVKVPMFDCLKDGVSYESPLHVNFRVEIKDPETNSSEFIEERVFMGDIPMMTDRATYIINGAERVIISQLHRTPGICFEQNRNTSNKLIHSFRIIPDRGSWMEVQFDNHELIYIYLDRRRRRRKFLVSTFLRAVYSDDNRNILDAIYGVKKVSVKKLAKDENLANYRIVEDIVDSDDLVAAKALEPVTLTAIEALQGLGVSKIEVVDTTELGPSFITNLEKDPTSTREEALTHIFKKMRPGDLPDLKTAEALIKRFFFDTKTYDLGRVGRHKVNQRLALDELDHDGKAKYVLLAIDQVKAALAALDEEDQLKVYLPVHLRPYLNCNNETPTEDQLVELKKLLKKKAEDQVSLVAEAWFVWRTLLPVDLVAATQTVMDIRYNKKKTDDIDHLGSRRVRSVGELVNNQFRSGLARTERVIRERMTLQHDKSSTSLMPSKLVNTKTFQSVVRDFFGRSQLSQFMDQTNPLSEITAKRRLSALGPGGLNRERAGFEVRDVHSSHYGRICPIETPEGPNIGLISSLSIYAKINDFGFLETPYRKVIDGVVTTEFEFVSGDKEERFIIAQANAKLDENDRFVSPYILCRHQGESVEMEKEKVTHMDVSPKQLVSPATACIPFLEHDDANRALMGSNMQRQAVPLLEADSPYVGTGIEAVIARDSRAVAVSRQDGIVASATSNLIIITEDGTLPSGDIPEDNVYKLYKFMRSNSSTCMNQKPIVKAGDVVKKGDVIADGFSTQNGELALGKNVLVAFMTWCGYNFEDAIIISERLVKDDVFTSIHISEANVQARDTKLGPEEITRDIPNLGEEMLRNLGPEGVIRLGAEVAAGDILVGKITPRGETELSPEERLLRAIFGEKANDVKDSSLYTPRGVSGVVMDIRIDRKADPNKAPNTKLDIKRKRKELDTEYKNHYNEFIDDLSEKLGTILFGSKLNHDIQHRKTEDVIIPANRKITKVLLKKLAQSHDVYAMADGPAKNQIDEVIRNFSPRLADIQLRHDEKIEQLDSSEGQELGIIKTCKVYIAAKRKMAVGDKMAGRHGNKGIVSNIVPVQDMPFRADGTTVDILLNPLGVPSRMNVGQILETHLGMAGIKAGIKYAAPVFDGTPEKEINDLLESVGLPRDGKDILYDGRTGERFAQRITVGIIYMLKLDHLVVNKIHARAVGPYSLVTQQPLGGKAQHGGQRFGEMEVWALEAYGAAYTLQEMLTVKSDDVEGRTRIYESIVKGDCSLQAGLPESFNVLMNEMKALCLDIRLRRDFFAE